MTNSDDPRRPPRGGRGAPPSRGGERGRPDRGEGGKSFLTRRPRETAERPARPRPPAETRTFAEDAPPAEERIAKVIARAGLASRREAEAMIEAGRVSLNGTVVASPALNVGPEDRIAVDGEPLPSRERTRLWLFHKPRGLVTTFRDPEGRPTVFDSLPEDMPRVVAIGRLDINTEGLLLLTNDGGLAKVIAHPSTGWTRRYRARAHGGDVTQAQLDRLRDGITIDGIEYGGVEATLDRVQGDNVWISLSLREGKNREVKRILEHLGLQVNRLIRLSFGPFQLGEIEVGLVEEIRTKVLKEQLGAALAAEAGADFESPVREPIAPFGKEKASNRPPRPRRAGEDDRRPAPPRGRPRSDDRDGGRERPSRPLRGRDEAPSRDDAPKRFAWRADEDGGARTERPWKRDRRDDPKAERAATAGRPRSREKPIETAGGRVRVERLKPSALDEPRHRRDRPGRDGDEATARPPRGAAAKPRTGPGKPFADRGGAPSRGKSFGDKGGVSSRGKPFGDRNGASGRGKPGRPAGPPRGRSGAPSGGGRPRGPRP